MSQDNVELVRSIYAAWERSDYSSADWAHPEIERVADGPTTRARPGWLQYDSGAGVSRIRARPSVAALRPAGADVDSEIGIVQGANLFHVRGGKVTRLVLYWDRERALEAVGLRE